ncbi:hypothetical protein LCGC14_2955950, partial [marine sediment metagenome]
MTLLGGGLIGGKGGVKSTTFNDRNGVDGQVWKD